MKKYISIILLVFFSTIGISQPIIESSNFKVDFNNKAVRNWAHNYDSIFIGENIIWDFTHLDTSITQIDTVEFVFKDSICNGIFGPTGIYGGNYTDTTIFIKKGSSYFMYVNTNTELYMEGTKTSGAYYSYTDHKKIMDFPFSYDSVFADAYQMFYPGILFPFNHANGTIYVHADAYGTLILPNLTLNNVLKLKVKEWSYIPNTQMNDFNYFDIWYSPDIAYPVLEINKYGEALYLDEIIDLSLKPIELAESIRVYPIPANESIIVSLKNNGNNSNYTIFDILGRAVGQGILNGNEVLNIVDIRNLSQGMYFLYVESDGYQLIKKIIKE